MYRTRFLLRTYFPLLVIAVLLVSLPQFLLAQTQPAPKSPMVAFALERLSESSPNVVVDLSKDPNVAQQGFSIEKNGEHWLVKASDDHGLMYGILDLAESLKLGRPAAKSVAPKIHRRGLKFNIPLDARCPSYDDSGTSAVMNIPEVWSREFWHEFLDTMAENRFNVLSLWCNHPFTTMVSLDDYPDVAIHDVAIPTYEMDEHQLIQYRKKKLQDPQFYRVVKKMTIDEKIDHWRHVMRYAKERGIDIYFITWNIWLHGAEDKYGINDDQKNPKTIAYVRESMKQMVLTYPDLKGFGVTAGENMQNKLEGEHSTENWLWNTYGEGVADALKLHPDQKFDFIHRVWYTGVKNIKAEFIDRYPGRCDVGFKYARARLYAMEKPPFFDRQLRPEVEKLGLRCWMNLRNDDIYNFRWGNPDYARSFLSNLPPEPTLAGILMGSDGYVWGREFTSKHPQSPRQLEVDKHWYRFMMWGRLAYQPSLDPSFFEAKIGERFPEVDAKLMYSTWQVASKIVPQINLLHWRDWDHQWSVETCMSKKEGYHSVDHFIEFGPFRDYKGLSIPSFLKNPKRNGESPFSGADRLDELANQTLDGVEKLRKNSQEKYSQELQHTILDLEAFAHLAQYYADKIRGATELHRFRVTGDDSAKTAALDHVQKSIEHWQQYGSIASRLYDVQLLARVNSTDWLGLLLDKAKEDLQIVEQAEQGKFPPTKLLSNMPKEK